jgi:WD40 repeat protein
VSIGRLSAFLAILVASANSQTPGSQVAPDDPNRPHLVRVGTSQNLVRRLAFLTDSRTLITDDERNLTVWDTETGLVVRSTANNRRSKLTPSRNFLWRDEQDRPVTSRLNPQDPNAPQVLLRKDRPDLLLADALDATLLYRSNRTGQVLLTPTSESPSSPQKLEEPRWLAIPSGRGLVAAAALNPLGRTAAAGDDDGRFRVYDYVEKKTLFEMQDGDSVVWFVTFSPNGKLLAIIAMPKGCVNLSPTDANSARLNHPGDTCSGTSTVSVRDAATGKETYSVTSEQTPDVRVVFTPDSRSLALVGGNRIAVVDLAKKQTVRTFPLTLDLSTLEPGEFKSPEAAFSPDGKWLAETSHRRVYLMDTASGNVVRSLADPPMTGTSNSVLTRDGRLLAAVNRPTRIVVTELSPGVSSRVLRMNPVPLSVPAISADGSTLAGLATDRKVRVWDISREKLECTLPADGLPQDTWRAMELSSDGSQLVLPSAAPEGTGQGVEIWDVRSCRQLEKAPPGPAPPADIRYATATPAAGSASLPRINRIALSPDGRFVAWVTNANQLLLWNRAERRLIGARVPVPAVYSEVDDAARKTINHLQADGKSVFLATVETTGAPDRLLRFEQLAGGICGIDFSPDGSTVATLDFDGQTRLWSTANGRYLKTLGAIPEDTAFIVNNAMRFTFRGGTLAVSPDGRLAATTFVGRSKPMLWDLNAGTALRPLKGLSNWASGAAFTADGKTLMLIGPLYNLHAMDVATGGHLAEITVLGDGRDWLVHSPEGLFDGSPPAFRQVGWGFPGPRSLTLPMEAFFSDFYRPGLLPDLLAGKRFTASKDLNAVDRRQARVQILPTTTLAPGVAISEPRVALRIRAMPPSADDRNPTVGAIRDLRLFRNGSLVRIWQGDLKPSASGAVEFPISVPLTAGPNQFEAYCFNRDNVQSVKGILSLNGAQSLARKGIAYIVVVGVNRYQNSEFNLKYATADARMVEDQLAKHLKDTRRYAGVRVVRLLDVDASRQNLETVLSQLGGGVGGSVAGSQIGRARPEDAVVVFFAGHGWAQGGQFHLIPHDLGYLGPRSLLATDAAAQKTILDHAISDRELGGLLENIDAGWIALVIDACNSGQLLESDEARQGPFNSKGLAQLAWDKGMYVLTAAQSYQAALETSQLQHGYLTYALMEEGLNQRKADRNPEDGDIDIREWFDYAASRVPEMQRERSAEARILVQTPGGAKGPSRGGADPGVQTPRAFYRFELGVRQSIAGPQPAEMSDCSREQQMKSVGGPDAPLTFENANPSSVRKLYWLDYSGNRQLWTTLAPGASQTEATFAGHVWVVTDAGNQCLGIYTAGPGRRWAVIQK